MALGRLKLWLALMFVPACVGSGIAQAQSASGIPPEVLHYADFVLYNGQVITADRNFSIAEAVAVRDNRIFAVGPTSKVLPLAGPKTRRIDLPLWAATLWSAEQLAEDDRLGSIEKGKLADLLILDKDYLTVPEDDIQETKVLLTMVDGRVVWEVPDALAAATN